MRKTFAHTAGVPLAPPTLIRVWYSVNGDGHSPLTSRWIAFPPERPYYQAETDVAGDWPRELIITRE